MSFPLTTLEAVSIIPGLDISTTDLSVNTANITNIINAESDIIRGLAFDKGYNYTTPTTHQSEILALVSQFPIWRNIIMKRVGNCDPSGFLEFLDFIDFMGFEIATNFTNKHFDSSWLASASIPSVQLATELESASLVPSFTLDITSKPNIVTITNFTKQFSAMVYSFAYTLGLSTPSDLSLIPVKVRSFYQEVVSYATGSLILAIHSASFGEQAKVMIKYAKKLWLEVSAKLILFRRRRLYALGLA